MTDKVPGLIWSGVTYDISPSRSKLKRSNNVESGRRRILNGVSGNVARGEFVAILGASGAGKTTLLNALSARMGPEGDLSGEILFDGTKRKGSSWKRIVGYVQQEDALLPRATVRETIETAAKLRLPAMSVSDKLQRAQEVMDMLRLGDCAESRIGNEAVRGVSGGERKRVSIGVVSRRLSYCGLKRTRAEGV